MYVANDDCSEIVASERQGGRGIFQCSALFVVRFARLVARTGCPSLGPVAQLPKLFPDLPGLFAPASPHVAKPPIIANMGCPEFVHAPPLCAASVEREEFPAASSPTSTSRPSGSHALTVTTAATVEAVEQNRFRDLLIGTLPLLHRGLPVVRSSTGSQSSFHDLVQPRRSELHHFVIGAEMMDGMFSDDDETTTTTPTTPNDIQ